MSAELRSTAHASASPPTPDWRQQARRSDLESRISSHLEYARFLTFVRENLVRNKRYRLALSDLTTLEIRPNNPGLLMR